MTDDVSLDLYSKRVKLSQKLMLDTWCWMLIQRDITCAENSQNYQ